MAKTSSDSPEHENPSVAEVLCGVLSKPGEADAKAARLSPAWLREVLQQLQQLLELPANWNSYRARPIRPEMVAFAGELLREIARVDTPQPIVTPTVRGGVQLEWHTRGIDLEIELESPDRLEVFFEDLEEGTVCEAELGLSDMPRLAEFVARLSR